MGNVPKEPKSKEPRGQRLYQRRWCRPCKDCGEAVVFLDNPRPPILGKRWSQWVLVELYGERDGILMSWNGEIVFNPALHVEHTDCPRVRRRKAWWIRRAQEDI